MLDLLDGMGAWAQPWIKRKMRQLQHSPMTRNLPVTRAKEKDQLILRAEYKTKKKFELSAERKAVSDYSDCDE